MRYIQSLGCLAYLKDEGTVQEEQVVGVGGECRRQSAIDSSIGGSGEGRANVDGWLVHSRTTQSTPQEGHVVDLITRKLLSNCQSDIREVGLLAARHGTGVATLKA